MRLGFIAYSLEEEVFQFAAENGFACVEYNSCPGQLERYEAAAPRLAEWSKKHGVSITSFGYFGAEYHVLDEEKRALAFKDAERSVKVCLAMGAPVFVMGAGSRPALPNEKGKPVPMPIDAGCRRAIEVLGPLVARAEGAGLQVALYNCDWGNFVYNESGWGALLYAFPRVGIKFDPSHPFYRGEDYLAQIAQWGHRFLHVHAKGSVKVRGQRFTDPPAGLDQTDWPSFFSILKKAGYTGAVNLEPHSGEWQGAALKKGLLFSRDYLRPFLKAVD